MYLVDDDAEDRAFLVEAISEIAADWKVIEFANGVELMSRLHTETNTLPDLIFLDLRMPMMDGFECLTDIKSNVRLDFIPVAIYSNWYNKEELEKLQTIGANFFLIKPSTFVELKNALGTIIKEIDIYDNSQTRELRIIDFG